MQAKLRMSPDQVFEQAKLAVRFARRYTDDIEFSTEDGSRSDPDFLCRVIEAVIAEGATTINIPDTVGYAVPEQYGRVVALAARAHSQRAPRGLVGALPQRSGHGGGQLPCRRAQRGARQIECTINGLGERAGNTALEEVVMALRTRKDVFGVETRLDTTQIVASSRLVSNITGFPVQPNKAVVGANAFAHASGIHQDGMLKSPQTYEIMRAEDVGWSANRIVLGKLSGRNAFKQRVQELGIPLESENELQSAFARFKELADRKAEIFDEDIQSLFSDEEVSCHHEHFRLVSMAQNSRTGGRPSAEVVFHVGASRRNASIRKATARSTRSSRPSRAVWTAAPSCCCIRSTRSPRAPSPRARSRCDWRAPGASSMAWARTRISWPPRPRPTSARSTSCTRPTSALNPQTSTI